MAPLLPQDPSGRGLRRAAGEPERKPRRVRLRRFRGIESDNVIE